MTLSRCNHWENVYNNKEIDQVSWYQENCSTSLDMITNMDLKQKNKIIDVGSGATRLIESLLSRGYNNLSALDISKAALNKAKEQLGETSKLVNWIQADITDWNPNKVYDLWHDRAVYHFLTQEADRKAYVRTLKKALNPGGHLLISSFGLEGPEKCSNLPVRRHSPEMFDEELGPEFERIESKVENHETPWGSNQQFVFCWYKYLG